MAKARMMDPKLERMVCDILGSNNIPDDLTTRIKHIDALCGICDGALRSRQIIAVIIDQWEREHRNE